MCRGRMAGARLRDLGFRDHAQRGVGEGPRAGVQGVRGRRAAVGIEGFAHEKLNFDHPSQLESLRTLGPTSPSFLSAEWFQLDLEGDAGDLLTCPRGCALFWGQWQQSSRPGPAPWTRAAAGRDGTSGDLRRGPHLSHAGLGGCLHGLPMERLQMARNAFSLAACRGRLGSLGSWSSRVLRMCTPRALGVRSFEVKCAFPGSSRIAPPARLCV